MPFLLVTRKKSFCKIITYNVTSITDYYHLLLNFEDTRSIINMIFNPLSNYLTTQNTVRLFLRVSHAK